MKVDQNNPAAYHRQVSEAQRQLTQEDMAALRQLHEFHKKQKAKMQKSHQDEIDLMNLRQFQARMEKQRELAQVSEQLTAIREQGREESAKLTAMQEQLKNNYIRQNQETAAIREAYQQALTEDFQRKAQNLMHKGLAEQDAIRHQTDMQMLTEQLRHQRQVTEQALAHQAARQEQALNQSRVRERENEIFQRQLQILQKDHFNQLEHMRQMNEDRNQRYAANYQEQAEHLRDHYTQRRFDQEQALQDNFRRHRQEMTDSLEKAQARMQQELVNVQRQAAYLKQTTSDQLQDAFYRFEKLPATLTETADGVQLSIKVPPHEKNNVLLHIHGRELRLAFSRRVEQKLADTGGQGRYARSESLSQEFTAPHILDPRSIKQTYANGVLTFTVRNA